MLDHDFTDVSAFRATLARSFATPPRSTRTATILSAAWIETRLGAMVMLTDVSRLHLLEFASRPDLGRQMLRHQGATNARFILAETEPAAAMARQLDSYFSGRTLQFDCTIAAVGTPFQLQVWTCLRRTRPGATMSYTALAHEAGRPNAIRAAAAANAMNRCAIVIPCHRIIGRDGGLTGYAGGLERKQWLLDHEARHTSVISRVGAPPSP